MTRKNQLLLILLALPATLGAQNFKGTVYYRDPKGAVEALPFAQVYHIEKETLLECDEHGEFALEIKKKATLVATYVGYSQDTVVVDAGTASANFYLTGANEVEQAVISARQAGLSRLSQVKTEAITAAGLCKMACCNLAESFENSASVSVGYSDAVTGARQIKLLGLSGVYTQMQDEKMPIMRGLASTFGLNYVPGQWLESIQISKGPSSVANDAAGITGQINMEHRKPIDETPLFVNLYGSTDEMFEMNVASALQLNEKWSTIILA
ncbi:MAG: carboxypeptidase-like regulatory domain-containing protein, partial [Bacteroidales bacterium]|nr:carboxypeptidase-like regulatory domain-containing protein [Bacteroidales bacterium]